MLIKEKNGATWRCLINEGWGFIVENGDPMNPY